MRCRSNAEPCRLSKPRGPGIESCLNPPRRASPENIADELAQRLGIGGGESPHRADDEVLLDGGEDWLEHGLLDELAACQSATIASPKPSGCCTWLVMAMMTMSRVAPAGVVAGARDDDGRALLDTRLVRERKRH